MMDAIEPSPGKAKIRHIVFHDRALGPFLSIACCHDGFWRLPEFLVMACAALAQTNDYLLQFSNANGAELEQAAASIVFQSGTNIADYTLTAQNSCPPSPARFHCVIGDKAPPMSDLFAGRCIAANWNAALALVRLLVPASGLLTSDIIDAIATLSGRLTRCETWQFGAMPAQLGPDVDSLFLGFSNRLLLDEVEASAQEVRQRLPAGTDFTYWTCCETVHTLQVDALVGIRPGEDAPPQSS